MFNVLRYAGLKDEGYPRVCGFDMLRIFDQGIAYGSIVLLANKEDISWWAWPSQGKQVVAASFWVAVSIELEACWEQCPYHVVLRRFYQAALEDCAHPAGVLWW